MPTKEGNTPTKRTPLQNYMYKPAGLGKKSDFSATKTKQKSRAQHLLNFPTFTVETSLPAGTIFFLGASPLQTVYTRMIASLLVLVLC